MKNKDIPQDKQSEYIPDADEQSVTIERYLDDYKDLVPELTDNIQKTIEETTTTFRTAVDEAMITFKTAIDEAIEIVKKENPSFKDIPFSQLKNNAEFQKELNDYMTKNPPTPPKLEVLNSIVPLHHIKPVNKLANNITKNIIDMGELALVVSNKKSKKDVTTKVMLAYDNRHIQLSGREKYTPYDREVYDGVVTLYEAGNEIITPVTVYRAMNGLTESEKVSPQSIEAVKKSLDKSRFIRATIDYTEEARLYNQKIDKTVYEGYLLAAEKVIVKTGGTEQEGYILLRKPLLYEYAQISGQILTVSAKLLQTKDAVRSTDEVIVIRGYLLRQIGWIKNDKTTRSDNITYQGIYEELDISKIVYDEAMYKKKTHATRTHVKSILDEWQEQEYIENYEEYKEGKTIKGVKITI